MKKDNSGLRIFLLILCAALLAAAIGIYANTAGFGSRPNGVPGVSSIAPADTAAQPAETNSGSTAAALQQTGTAAGRNEPAPQDSSRSGSVTDTQTAGRTAAETKAADSAAAPAESAGTAKTLPVQPNGTAASDAVILPAGLELPVCSGNRTAGKAAADHQIRRFAAYTICYRETYEEAEWAAYELDRSELTKAASRSDNFRPDPAITTGSATLADYRSSGYDRGHLAPAADFSFSAHAMSESFFLSNMTPQAPAFNRGIWKELEEQVRDWADRFGRVYVVCGPVLDAPAEKYEVIGADKVAIPRYFYKVILVPEYKDAADAATPGDAARAAAVGFIIPNKSCTDSFWDYAVPVDTVEARTGLDFYAPLDDNTENAVEASFSRADF